MEPILGTRREGYLNCEGKGGSNVEKFLEVYVKVVGKWFKVNEGEWCIRQGRACMNRTVNYRL